MKNCSSNMSCKVLIITLNLLFGVFPNAFSQFQSFTPALNISQPSAISGTAPKSNTPVEIIINNNGIHLKGQFYISEGSGNFPTVILLQGFPGNEPVIFGLCKKLSEVGLNTLTFNYSGTFKSEGEFCFPNTLKDIEAAIHFIKQPDNITKFNVDTSRIILGGYSLGGGMAFTYAAIHPEIKEIFSLSGNDHGEFIRNYQRDEKLKKTIDAIYDELNLKPDVVRFAPGGRPKEFLEMKIIESNPIFDLRYCAPLVASRNILLIGGWNDLNVPIETIVLPLYRALYRAKASNLNIRAVQDSHSFRKSGDELTQIITDWIKSK